VASSPTTIRLALPDLTLDLRTDHGVFAREGIDPGTKLLLLEAPAVVSSGHLLDLGCGYGPIALTLARRCPDATVWAVDVNRRARSLTEVNAASAGLTNVRVAAPDEVPPEVRFAAIRSNPPIRIGKEPLHTLLLDWLPRLEPGAAGVFVVQRHLGADSLAGWLRGQGWSVNRLTSRMSYRLLEVARPDGADDEGDTGR
jgi:16S rRNA (guanine1207-N2)-methyltransferase